MLKVQTNGGQHPMNQHTLTSLNEPGMCVTVEETLNAHQDQTCADYIIKENPSKSNGNQSFFFFMNPLERILCHGKPLIIVCRITHNIAQQAAIRNISFPILLPFLAQPNST